MEVVQRKFLNNNKSVFLKFIPRVLFGPTKTLLIRSYIIIVADTTMSYRKVMQEKYSPEIDFTLQVDVDVCR
jgi:hypothetical protein